MILTVSRMEEEKKSNPGYRAFFANGYNVTRTLVLFVWEVVLEWTAALRAMRRDVRPRGHRGGIYPLMRGALCVFVRDLIVYGVLTDMMRGRPAVYATFSSYDEVAHHSGLERADTLEALRKLDDQFAHIEHARRYAPRPYEIVVLSDHGQTQGATFKQRNGYGLDELVERSLARGDVTGIAGGDEQSAMVGNAVNEATGKKAKKAEERRLRPRRRRARLGQPRPHLPDGGAPPPDARGDRRAPSGADPRAPRASRTSAGCSSAPRSAEPLALGAQRHALPRATGASRARIRSRSSHPTRPAAPAAHRRLRARRRHHGRQLLRPRARRGLRLRGADLVPRRHRRACRRGRSSSTRRSSRFRRARSSARRACTASSLGWRQQLQGGSNGTAPTPAEQAGRSKSPSLAAIRSSRSGVALEKRGRSRRDGAAAVSGGGGRRGSRGRARLAAGGAAPAGVARAGRRRGGVAARGVPRGGGEGEGACRDRGSRGGSPGCGRTSVVAARPTREIVFRGPGGPEAHGCVGGGAEASRRRARDPREPRAQRLDPRRSPGAWRRAATPRWRSTCCRRRAGPGRSRTSSRRWPRSERLPSRASWRT